MTPGKELMAEILLLSAATESFLDVSVASALEDSGVIQI